VLDAAHVALGQAIEISQAGPAVGAIHEFVAEAQPQARMREQVRDARQPQCVRARLGHAEGIVVLEADGAAKTDAVFGKTSGKPLARRRGLLCCNPEPDPIRRVGLEWPASRPASARTSWTRVPEYST
jgi:hypothetical protein